MDTINGTFTWNNKRGGTFQVASTLDRFIILEDLLLFDYFIDLFFRYWPVEIIIIFLGYQFWNMLTEALSELRSVCNGLLCYVLKILNLNRFHFLMSIYLFPLRIYEFCDPIMCPVIHGRLVKEPSISLPFFNPLYS